MDFNECKIKDCKKSCRNRSDGEKSVKEATVRVGL